MKAYKGFNKDMTCRGFQFKEGEIYKEDTAKLCKSGFHACENPMDCLKYYPLNSSVYHEVELDEVTNEHDNDSKCCGKIIKIGAKLDIIGIVNAAFDFVYQKSKDAAGCFSHAAAAGDISNATAAGYWSNAAAAGDSSNAAAAGDWSNAAAAGDWSNATATGVGSNAAAAGKESTATANNKNSLAIATGKGAKARGIKGAYIVLTEWNDEATEIIAAKMAQVDGEKIKADTWYKLENGEFVEVGENE